MDVAKIKEEIVQRLDIQQFFLNSLNKLGIHVSDLRFDSDGWSNKQFWPNHNDNRTPNCAFNSYNGSFKCFACDPGFGGSIFDFWCFVNGLDKKIHFKKAVETLALEAGID